MKITFIIPSRNNLKYLQQSVNSILGCYGEQHDIVLLDDASTDGTWEWIQSLEGNHFIKYRNEGPDRVGHTILYDKGVELSKTEIFTIFHADMITTPNHIPNLLKHLKRGIVVSATRIEPPLHPPGSEKFVKMYGMEPIEFKKGEFDLFVKKQENIDKNKITNGIFAPWCMYKSDFESIGGHDPLFAPMELEDSDIFNRMYLTGYKLIQSRDAFVYHMTCRGSRFKDGIEIEAEIPLPDGTIWYKPKDSEEYKELRAIKFREWRRKWGCNVLHDEFLMPIVPHKYGVGLVVKNCNLELLRALEPWCDKIYIDDDVIITHYIDEEQKNTKFDLSSRVRLIHRHDPICENDIVVEFDGMMLNQNNFIFIERLSEILTENEISVGYYEMDIFKFHISSVRHYEKDLIKIG